MADSLDSSGKPSWFVQILFGRYRSLGAIQWTHLAVIGGVGFVLLYTYLYFLRRKFNHYSKAMAKLPCHRLDIRKKTLGRRMYSLLVGEMVRVDALLDAGLPPQTNFSPLCGDPGWGKEGGNVDNVHFDTSIAKSFYALEKTALQRRPGLRQRDSRSIREYILALRKAFPSLKASLCDEYLATYERAVFGDHKHSYEEYNHFMKIVVQIVAAINEKGYNSSTTATSVAGGFGAGGLGGMGLGGMGAPAAQHRLHQHHPLMMEGMHARSITEHRR